MITKTDMLTKIRAEIAERVDTLSVVHTSKHAGGHTKPRDYRKSKRSRRKAQKRARRRR